MKAQSGKGPQMELHVRHLPRNSPDASRLMGSPSAAGPPGCPNQSYSPKRTCIRTQERRAEYDRLRNLSPAARGLRGVCGGHTQKP